MGEIKRFDVDKQMEEYASVKIKCLGCGETKTLWYNGGELDSLSCCGYDYDLESRGTDLVVWKED